MFRVKQLREYRNVLMFKTFSVLACAALFLTAAPASAQNNLSAETLPKAEWYATGFVQYSRGDYIFGTNTNTFYLVPGLRYETREWNFSAVLPIVSQNNNLVTGTGGMLIPHGGSGMNGSSGMGRMGNSGGTPATGSSNITGLGDLFLSGEYDFLPPDSYNSSPVLGINVQIKVPVASTTHNLGTGKFDFSGSLNYRQRFDTFVIMANAGYLFLGKPAGADFKNSVMYGGGVGKFISDGDISVVMLYQGYSTILPGYFPPDQASLGFNYKINSAVMGTIVLSKGLTNTAPAFGMTGGFRWKL